MVRVRGRNPRLTAAHASPTPPQIPARRGLVALRPDRRRKPFVINIRKILYSYSKATNHYSKSSSNCTN